jgi:hypothetical protein
MAVLAFGKLVSARTRCVKQILATPELLAAFNNVGGKDSDLQAIANSGDHAEAFNLAQSQAKGGNVASTVEVHKAFAELQREYSAVMAVLQAVILEFARAGTDIQTLAALKQILVNEAQVVVTADAGTATGSAKRSRSHEALRAEIQKDASALLALSAAGPTLAGRKVDAVRLTKLRDAAAALSGKLSERAVNKGVTKAATQEERKAVAEQKEVWASTIRLLMLAAANDARIKALLSEAVDAKA